jgi:serine/threonine protein kinase
MTESERDVIQLLGEAVEQRSPAEQEAFLDRACAGDPERRARIEQLLRAYQSAGSFLERKPTPDPLVTLDDPITEHPGAVIGPYRLMEQIGEGGMGLVFVAEQQHPVRRKVALKVIKPGMDTRQVVARFEAERQALALMDHPNIAKVFDGGTTSGEPGGVSPGRPYFVMELVKGVPITDFCDQNQVPIRERLELLISVCQAVQHAHQKGIIHRDIKPSNVLVVSHDGKPVVKVIDFGVAKATGQHLTDKTVYTQFTQLIGTPLYMSPEQAGLSGLDVDTRSDIYSLGVLLYELLTGTTPFAKERFKTADYDEIRRIIREEEPPRPSTRLSTLAQAASTVATRRHSDPKHLRVLCRGELDWIVMKCLEKDRNRRYETANGLARDIERYLRDEPVLACPPSAWYRLRKTAHRHRGKLAAAAAMLVLLLGGAAASAWQAVRATRAERKTGDALEQVTAEQVKTQEALVAVTSAEAKTRDALTATITAQALTREALDALTDDVIARLLFRQPELDDADKAFLRKVLDFYESFTETDANSAETRYVRAKGYFKIAELRDLLGKVEQAETDYRKAESLLTDLNKETPYRIICRQNLANTKSRLAVVLAKLGKQKESETSFREALDLAEDLATDSPNDLMFQRLLAETYMNLGLLHMRAVNFPAAEKAYRKGIKVREDIVALAGDVPDAHQELANSRMVWAQLLRLQGKFDEADKVLRETVPVQVEQLKRKSPPVRRWELANGYGEWAVVLTELKKTDEAADAFHQAIELMEKLKDEFPGVVKYRELLGTTHLNLGTFQFRQRDFVKSKNAHDAAVKEYAALLAEGSTVPEHRKTLAAAYVALAQLFQAQGKKAEANEALQNALPHQRKLAGEFSKVLGYHNDLVTSLGMLSEHQTQPKEAATLLEEAHKHALAARDISPKDPAVRRNYLNVLAHLASVYQFLGDHVNLAATAEEGAISGSDPPVDHYASAGVLCRCAVLAEKDAALADSERSKLTQRYADRALALLDKAVKSGFKDAADMKQNPNLQPLHGRQEFDKLVAELEEKNKP